jgi:hypothetical protein
MMGGRAFARPTIAKFLIVAVRRSMKADSVEVVMRKP